MLSGLTPRGYGTVTSPASHTAVSRSSGRLAAAGLRGNFGDWGSWIEVLWGSSRGLPLSPPPGFCSSRRSNPRPLPPRSARLWAGIDRELIGRESITRIMLQEPRNRRKTQRGLLPQPRTSSQQIAPGGPSAFMPWAGTSFPLFPPVSAAFPGNRRKRRQRRLSPTQQTELWTSTVRSQGKLAHLEKLWNRCHTE